jgi:hypothetical protein
MSKQTSQLCGMHTEKLHSIEKSLTEIKEMLLPVVKKTERHSTAIFWITMSLGVIFSGIGIAFGFLIK